MKRGWATDDWLWRGCLGGQETPPKPLNYLRITGIEVGLVINLGA